MNDPTVLEASRVFAAALLMEETPTKEKIIKAFRTILCRQPKENEITLLDDYYGRELKLMTRESAEDLLAVGEYPVTRQVDHRALAAMMLVVNTLYNLEETITKS